MIGTPPGTLRVLWLLAGSAVRRTLRMAQIARAERANRQSPTTAGASQRQATSKRRGNRGLTLLLVLMIPIWLVQAVIMARQGVEQLHRTLAAAPPTTDELLVDDRTYVYLENAANGAGGSQPTEADTENLLRVLRLLPDAQHEPEVLLAHLRRHGLAGFRKLPSIDDLARVAADREPMAIAGAWLLLLVTVTLLTMSLGNANLELGRANWAFPWLLCFPVPTRAVVLAKVGEYGLVQPMAWFTAFPLTWQLLGRSGSSEPAAIALAALFTLMLCAAVGGMRLASETWLRFHLPLQRVRSIQGLATLLALAGLTMLMLVVMNERPPAWFVDLVRASPGWLALLPTSWPLTLARGELLWLPSALLLLAMPAAAVWAVVRMLRSGTERAVSHGTGARIRSQRPAAFGRLGILKKELLLLVRDRNFAIQTLVVPLFVIGLQVFLREGSIGRMTGSHAVLLAYGAGALMASSACFLLLSSEGRALWLLYAMPHAMGTMLRRKVQLWAPIACAMASGVFVLLVLQRTEAVPTPWYVDLVWLCAGIYGAAWLAAGIGTLSTDPSADQVPRQPKARYVYLYLYLAGSYALGLAATDLTTRATTALVFATLAWSLWQRVRDRLPWLLDPQGEPTAPLGVFEAGVLMTTFFLLQGLLAIVLAKVVHEPLLGTAIGYVAAGGLTAVLATLMANRRDLPPRRGDTVRTAPAIGLGIVAGGGLGLLGIGWKQLAERAQWCEFPAAPNTPDAFAILIVLVVLAAPLLEEFLFRRILFLAMQRSLPNWLAVVWSAALFTVVHPVPSWPPVFLLGVATALLLARSGVLLASIALHAVYNLVVVLGN